MIKPKIQNRSITIIAIFLWLFLAIIIGRLFHLQVLKYAYYQAWATNTHEIYKQIIPKRGNVYIQDSRSNYNTEYPVAVLRPYNLVFAVPRDISKDKISSTTEKIAEILKFDDEAKKILHEKLSKNDDPYEPVADKVMDKEVEELKKLNLDGIKFVSRDYRYYPENNLLGSVMGFVGSDVDGKFTGRYGIEGAWDRELVGSSGYLSGKMGASGSYIALAGKQIQKAENGVELLLTIDRSIQATACKTLQEGTIGYQAQSGSLVMLDAKTGAVLAMCSYPDYNPNEYYKVKDSDSFNNSNIFKAYEPGSVFKPITMATGLDLELVNPNTPFTDPGMRLIDGYQIYNALKKNYGNVDMTTVLQNSINTGVIWVQEKIGSKQFLEYIEKFGYGKKTGIRLDSEVAGDIRSLHKSGAIYGANGSFGQGFTATPLQLAASYTVLANDGKLMKPYIVEEIRHPNGKVEKQEPQVVGKVISSRAQKLITGMLISVVENGQGYVAAKMKDFYVAGKTGTAQIASTEGGYSEATNHTFIGYFPANNPQFVLLVKYEAPQRLWAESTAAPTFKKVADFTVNYYGIKGEK